MDNVFELVGVNKIDFKGNDGKPITGNKIYYLMNPTADQKLKGFTGRIADSKFFPAGASIPNNLTCGKSYEFIFGVFGGKAVIRGFRDIVMK